MSGSWWDLFSARFWRVAWLENLKTSTAKQKRCSRNSTPNQWNHMVSICWPGLYLFLVRGPHPSYRQRRVAICVHYTQFQRIQANFHCLTCIWSAVIIYGGIKCCGFLPMAPHLASKINGWMRWPQDSQGIILDVRQGISGANETPNMRDAIWWCCTGRSTHNSEPVWGGGAEKYVILRRIKRSKVLWASPVLPPMGVTRTILILLFLKRDLIYSTKTLKSSRAQSCDFELHRQLSSQCKPLISDLHCVSSIRINITTKLILEWMLNSWRPFAQNAFELSGTACAWICQTCLWPPANLFLQGSSWFISVRKTFTLNVIHTWQDKAAVFRFPEMKTTLLCLSDIKVTNFREQKYFHCKENLITLVNDLFSCVLGFQNWGTTENVQCSVRGYTGTYSQFEKVIPKQKSLELGKLQIKTRELHVISTELLLTRNSDCPYSD